MKWDEISLAPRCRQSVIARRRQARTDQHQARRGSPHFVRLSGPAAFPPRSYSIPLAPFHSATLVGYERPFTLWSLVTKISKLSLSNQRSLLLVHPGLDLIHTSCSGMLGDYLLTKLILQLLTSTWTSQLYTKLASLCDRVTSINF